MTEDEWLSGTDPARMLAFVLGTVSDRKSRLFAVACGRLLRHGVAYEQADSAFAVAERFADQEISEHTLRAVREQASSEVGQLTGFQQRAVVDAIWAAVYSAADEAEIAAGDTLGFVRAILRSIPDWTICRMANDIFGNPFRPVTFASEWRTDTAVSLARGMYESRDFGAMPIMADALQDAGCDSDDILNHCRNATQLHVRGCWVVDLVLGKA